MLDEEAGVVGGVRVRDQRTHPRHSGIPAERGEDCRVLWSKGPKDQPGSVQCEVVRGGLLCVGRARVKRHAGVQQYDDCEEGGGDENVEDVRVVVLVESGRSCCGDSAVRAARHTHKVP